MKKKEINYQLLIRRIGLIVLDIICIIAASILALLTRFEFDFSQIPKEFLKVIYKYGPFTIVITLTYIIHGFAVKVAESHIVTTF